MVRPPGAINYYPAALALTRRSVMSFQRFPRLRCSQIRSFSVSPHPRSLNAKALPFAEKISAEWKGTSATGGTTKNFIGGEFVESKSSQWFDVLDPVRKMSPLYHQWLTGPVYANIGYSCASNHRKRVSTSS